MNPSEKHILEIDSVELSFGDRRILSGVYLAVETGGVTAVLGRNGCGKSCLMKILATCTAKAKCSTCNAEYGEKLPHDFTAETAEEQYLKSGSSCTEKAVYYKSCTVCGLSSKGTASEATFESDSVLGHEWGAWTSNGNVTHTRVCSRDASHTETENCHGGTADCTHKAACTVCGGEYGEMAAHSFTAEKPRRSI